jgi:putative hydrolase of the HAD superfamily
MPRVVAFDVDGTLVDLLPAIHAGLAAALDELLALTPAMTSSGPAHPWADHTAVEVRRTAPAAEIRLFADALPALAALRPHYALGIGSNGNSHARRCGLGGIFDFAVYAHVDAVPPKPSPAFFARLLAAAGAAMPGAAVGGAAVPGVAVAGVAVAGVAVAGVAVPGVAVAGPAVAGVAPAGSTAGALPPHEVVYVGDSLDDDIVPATAAGLRTVWLNRSGAPTPPDLRCDAVIGTLADLPAALQALELVTAHDRHNFPEVVVMGGR